MGTAMVNVFESADRAKEAVERLEQGGFDTSKLSLIGKEELSAGHPLGIAIAGGESRAWGRRSALWNSIAGAPAIALAWVPYTGHVVAVGPAAASLVGCATGLERMLVRAGMPAGSVRELADAIRGGGILLLVQGGARDASRAGQLISGPVH
jgi:hypothetical protein